MTVNQRESPNASQAWPAPLALAAILVVRRWQIKTMLSLLPPIHQHHLFSSHSCITAMGDHQSATFKGAYGLYVFWGKFCFSKLSHGCQLSFPEILGTLHVFIKSNWLLGPSSYLWLDGPLWHKLWSDNPTWSVCGPLTPFRKEFIEWRTAFCQNSIEHKSHRSSYIHLPNLQPGQHGL